MADTTVQVPPGAIVNCPTCGLAIHLGIIQGDEPPATVEVIHNEDGSHRVIRPGDKEAAPKAPSW